MKSGGLLGKQVVGSGGWTIGKVKEIAFDEKSWHIGSIEIELDRSVAEEYQMKKILSRTTIAVDVATVHAIGDHVVLTVTKPELQRMVSFQK